MDPDLVRCPCGGDRFDRCCASALDDGVAPATAEALMRSRYSAFTLGRRDYLLQSWATATRPATLELDDETEWRRLVIIDTVAGGTADTDGTVEFRAVYRDGGGRGELHERSRFVREPVAGEAGPGRWRYLDGEILD